LRRAIWRLLLSGRLALSDDRKLTLA